MKQLTEQQITSNWDKLRGIINDTFSGERLEKLNKMYDYFEDRMVVAPASGRAHFHNAMVGGYVEHILHIVKFSQELRDMWEKNGATINFTNEELVFAALHHDLGKVGDLEHDYYIPQESDWHLSNEKYYKGYNPDFGLRSNIAYILHQADMMATHIESNQWERGDKVESEKVQKSVTNIKAAVDKEVKEKFNTKSSDAKDIFNELFGEQKK
jgi:hypothetical protein